METASTEKSTKGRDMSGCVQSPKFGRHSKQEPTMYSQHPKTRSELDHSRKSDLALGEIQRVYL